MSLFPAQIGPLLDTTKSALTADQVNLMLVVIVFVVAAQTVQSWRYSVSMDKLRGALDGGFQSVRADQRDSDKGVGKLADAVERFSGKMMEAIEGFARRINLLGQQMDAGFEATASVIDSMDRRLVEADRLAVERNRQVLDAVRKAGEDAVLHINAHIDGVVQRMNESLDLAAAGVRQAVGEGVESLLKKQDEPSEALVLWGEARTELVALRGVVGQLGDILEEFRKVKHVQSIDTVPTADAVGGHLVGGAAADDSHPGPVGQPDAPGDRVLHQHPDGRQPVGDSDAQPTSVG